MSYDDMKKELWKRFKSLDEAERWLRKDWTQITYFLKQPFPLLVKLEPGWVSGRYEPWGVLRIGLKDIEDRDAFRKRLIHEYLHALGIKHSRRALALGFSSYEERDILSEKVRDWIFYGKPKPPELDILLREVE